MTLVQLVKQKVWQLEMLPPAGLWSDHHSIMQYLSAAHRHDNFSVSNVLNRKNCFCNHILLCALSNKVHIMRNNTCLRIMRWF